MPTPIVEQVGSALVTLVQGITAANGYSYPVAEVVRPSRKGFDPRHLLAVVMQEEPESAVDENGNPPILTLDYTWRVDVFIIPSDDDETSLDTYCNTLWADVVKRVSSGFSDATAGSIGMLAYNWRVLPPERFLEEDGFFGVAARFQSIVRVSETDPYTQR